MKHTTNTTLPNRRKFAAAPRLALAGLLVLAAGIARAPGQTVISSGTYTGANGSAGSPGTYAPPYINQPPVNGGNGSAGYTATSTGAPYTITGGAFTGGNAGAGGTGQTPSSGGNGGDGLLFQTGVLTLGSTISGGTFTGGRGGDAAQNGGSAGTGGNAVEISSGALTIRGGTFAFGTGGSNLPVAPIEFQTFGASGYSFLISGSLTLYGTFDGFSGTQTLTSGAGTLTGTLANNTTPATYTYDVTGGRLTIVSAVPEPGTTALLGLAAGAAGVLAWRKRRSEVGAKPLDASC